MKAYYYKYLKSFISFLVPENAQVLAVDLKDISKEKGVSYFNNIQSEFYDYVVISDALGYVYDIESFLRGTKEIIKNDGRVVITQYSALWEPVLRVATKLGLRNKVIEQNWLSLSDLRNFSHLAGFEIVKSGTKMIFPIYIPLVSYLLNNVFANIWPFTHAGLFHYCVIRKPDVSLFEDIGDEPSISIIVPARNEAGTIEKIARELPALGAFTEIIFIEGNSTDNTWDEIQRVAKVMGTSTEHGKKIKFGRQDGKGKGNAVRKGFDMATGDILAIYDADMTVPANTMERFYYALAKNKADFINGSRLVYPLEKQSMRLLNFFGNKFFSLAFTWILSQTLKDTLCGTKVLRKKDYEKIKKNRAFFGDFDPFGDFDLLFGAAKLNLKIIDLPIHYQDRVYGATNISRWKHGWLLLRMTIFAARKIKFI